jgi:feruloyl-CoA synthase
MSQSPSVPVRDVPLGPSEVVVREGDGGTLYVQSPHALPRYASKMTDRLDHWATNAPDRTFLAERGSDGEWRRLSFSEARRLGRNIGQALLNRGLSTERPIAIISSNDLEHALLGLGAMYAGVPYGPISTAYSLVSTDFTKLRHIFGILTPGLVFAADGEKYGRAIEAVLPDDAELVVTTNAGNKATVFDELISTESGPSLDTAHDKVGPDTIVKFLFTSGSTGMPKGVINTQKMWTSNSEMARGYFAFVDDEPPVIIDWLPWNHTFGGNADVGLVMYTGGTLYIDHGKPAPHLFEESVRNLREIAPTIYLNVPKAFETLIPYLRRESELRERFFSRLRLLFYAGAGLSQHVWDDLAELSVETCGERIMMMTGLGSTETAPHALFSNKRADRPGLIGGPSPGVELKLVPISDEGNDRGKLEARLRGPNITPGYWRQPELTEAAFDEEGFYKLGDALRFADKSDPQLGFMFDGRIVEDFKLSSGTWVSVGPLRSRMLAHFAPYVTDVVVAGHDRGHVSVLILPDLASCRSACGEELQDADPGRLLASDTIRSLFADRLKTFAESSTGSSNRVVSAILLDEPPSIDAHEVTDKGSLNQRAILQNRKALVEELYEPSSGAIVIDR